MKFKSLSVVVLCIITISLHLYSSENYNENWPTWRGPNCDGVAKGNPPIEWSETKNIKWKLSIPGLGQSTPIIWENQLFITTAIELDQKATDQAIKKLKKKTPVLGKVTFQSKTTDNFQQFLVYSIDKNTGEILWQKVVREQYPHEGIHKTGSRASSSCVTDGEHVIAFFGSFGTYCFDMSGNLVWEKDLGDMTIDMAFGEGASPVLYKEKLVIMWDHKGQSKIYVLNKFTGEILWEKDREEASTWSTPIIAEVNGKVQIVVPGKINSIGYNLETGEEVWTLSGLRQDIIPSPVYDGEQVYLMTGFIGKNKIVQAVNLSKAEGKIDSTEAIVWTHLGNTPYVPSPVLSNGKLYFTEYLKSKFSCIDAKTGKSFYLGHKIDNIKSVYASPIVSGGNIYLSGRKGNFAVIKESESFEVIARNKLNDKFDASPVIVGDQLYLRGWKSLYCISK